MAAIRRDRSYSALDLPHPARAAAWFALLVAAAAALDADPSLPWIVGVIGAALFAAAGTVRTARGLHELSVMRRTADHLIVIAPTSRDAAELVRWRTSELTSRAERDRLQREVARLVKTLDPGRLPSASPIRRPEARRSRALFEQLAARLGDERPVSARGVLLARALLRDPAGPLYSDSTGTDLAVALRR